MIRDLDFLPATVLAVVLAWAPLPFGSVTPEFRALLLVLVGVVVILAAALSKAPLPPLTATLPGYCALAVGLLGWLQSFAVPTTTARLGHSGHWRLSEQLDPLPQSLALSQAPMSSRAIAVVWLAVAAMWFATLMMSRSRRARVVVLGALAASGLFQTLYGGQRFIGEQDLIWGIAVSEALGRFRGTFVNPDHLAFYLGLLLPVVFAWMIYAVRHRLHVGEGDLAMVVWAPPALLWVALIAGLSLTGSRAGLVAALATVVVQGLLLARALRSWRMAWIGLSALTIGLMALGWLGARIAVDRLLATSTYELRWNQRLETYRATVDLIRQFPLTGAGLGSFREALSLTRSAELEGDWWHAHSDYLELAATTGFMGLVLLALAVAVIAWRLSRLLVPRQRSERLAAAIGGLGVLFAAGLHSAVDFGLSMPANAVTLSVLLALAVSYSAQPSRASQRARGLERAVPPE